MCSTHGGAWPIVCSTSGYKIEGLVDQLESEIHRPLPRFDPNYHMDKPHWGTGPIDWGDPEVTLKLSRFFKKIKTFFFLSGILVCIFFQNVHAIRDRRVSMGIVVFF